MDTANVNEIREALSWGVISGVTTNPTLALREGRDFKTVLKEIAELVNGPISAEVLSLNAEEMVEEARQLAGLSSNIVIKIPMCVEGLKAVRLLRQENIKTNVTLVFSAAQGLLAGLAGATYVSPFAGRMDDIGYDGMGVVKDLLQSYRGGGFETKVIVASVRHPLHVIEAAKIGADVATVPFKVLETMVRHPLTDKGIEQFMKDWQELNARLAGVKVQE